MRRHPRNRRALRAGLLAALALSAFSAPAGPLRLSVETTPDSSINAALADALGRAAAEFRANPSADVRIELPPGRHRLEAPIRIGPEHLPGPGGKIEIGAAQGQMATLSGALPVRDWTQAGENWVGQAGFPKGFVPGDLYVADARQPRSRLPNTGYLVSPRAARGSRHEIYTEVSRLDSVALPKGAWLGLLHEWSASLTPVETYDPATGRVTTALPIGASGRAYTPSSAPAIRHWFEGSPDFVDAPGEWAWQPSARTLLFRGTPGQSTAPADALVPVLPTLLTLRGNGTRTGAVLIRGLRFEHTFWNPAAAGYAGVHCTIHEIPGGSADQLVVPDAAVHLQRVEGVRFTGCEFRFTGATALHVREGCVGVVVDGCTFEDIGGTALFIGEFSAATAARDIVLKNSIIRRTGRRIPDAAGLRVNVARDVRIEDCRISNTPYCGIALARSTERSPAAYRVERNHISSPMEVLSDGAAIYIINPHPDTVLRHNRLDSILSGTGINGAHGVYLDEGADGVSVEENLFEGIEDAPVYLHQAGQNRLVRNVFVGAADARTVQFARTDPARLSQEGNLAVEIRGGFAQRLPGRRGLAHGGYPENGPAAPDPDGPVSISAWARSTRPPAPGKDPLSWVVAKNGAEGTAGHIGLAVASNGAVVATAHVQTANRSDRGLRQAWSKPDRFAFDGSWNHLLAVARPDRLDLYINGKRSGSLPLDSPRSTGKGPLIVGGFTPRAFPGQVDDVAWFTAELDPDDIARLASGDPAAKTAPPPALAGAFDMPQPDTVRTLAELLNQTTGNRTQPVPIPERAAAPGP
jgi:hypothetical protein